MSQDYTLYRGASGRPHLVGARCAHRATQLSTGWIEGDCIRCLYHGWLYDETGQCIEQIAEDSGFAAKIRIPSYPTREYLGLIWAYLGEGVPPPFPPIPAFAEGGVFWPQCNNWPCNYFQVWENDFDEFHAAWTHRTSGVHIAPDFSSTMFEETDYGIVRRNRKVDGTERRVFYLMPNCVRQLIPTPRQLREMGITPLRDTYIIHVPVDDASELFFLTAHARVPDDQIEDYTTKLRQWDDIRAAARPPTEIAAEILAGKYTLDAPEVFEHPQQVVIQDLVAQGGQGTIAPRGAPLERLGRTDVGIILLRKVWSRELRALEEGRPLTQWRPLTDAPVYPD